MDQICFECHMRHMFHIIPLPEKPMIVWYDPHRKSIPLHLYSYSRNHSAGLSLSVFALRNNASMGSGAFR